MAPNSLVHVAFLGRDAFRPVTRWSRTEELVSDFEMAANLACESMESFLHVGILINCATTMIEIRSPKTNPFRGDMKQILRWLFHYVHEPASSSMRMELRSINESLWSLGQFERTNHVLGTETRLRLNRIERELQQLVAGRLRFEATETWRTAYEELLSRCEAKRYLSAAIVRNEDYWQDVPGKKSMEFNLLLLEHRFYIHRILIIDDFLWPTAATTPGKPLMAWILEQYTAGIQIGLLRMSELEDEADLMRDFGIYGNEAVGHQHTDLQSRTLRYELSFDEADIRLAEDRWKRLSLYATPFEKIQETEIN